MYKSAIIAATLAVTLPVCEVLADYAELLEECGGHTNYGLMHQEHDGREDTKDNSTEKPYAKDEQVSVDAVWATVTSGGSNDATESHE